MSATGRATAILAASAWDPSILWAGAYLAGILLLAALAVELFRRYIRSERKDRLTASDQLAQYRSLYEQGVMSEEEFNSLRTLLGGELRRANRKAAPATDVSPAEPRTPDAAPPDGAARDPDRPSPETGIKQA